MAPTIKMGWIDELGMFFKVPSSTEENVKYDVHVWFNDPSYTWICNCLGNKYGHKCKHIQACETLLAGVME